MICAALNKHLSGIFSAQNTFAHPAAAVVQPTARATPDSYSCVSAPLLYLYFLIMSAADLPLVQARCVSKGFMGVVDGLRHRFQGESRVSEEASEIGADLGSQAGSSFLPSFTV